MASSVEGYEYDVFISYRQKDNKYDGWVTEFVTSLKNEIEATFKGSVGIYFDENPHDGLRETHDVDLSLNQKVKAIVMIPIISQTYCDPNSFSWKNEFLPFIEHANGDRFGMDINVINGNVAKRVLPIKIHEINKEDQELFEKAVGSNALRAIDFIYKGPGINRPLRASEENPHDNQNKTFYRDQINKVANSLREVMNGIQAMNEGKEIEEVIGKSPESPKPRPSLQTGQKPKRNPAILVAIVLLLTILGYFLYPKIFGDAVALERSIAVLPFVDMSPDKDQEYFSDGLSEEILNALSRVEDMKVAGRTSSFSFKGTDVSLKDIGNELGVSYILDGSVRKSGDMLRISAQLLRADNGFQLWSETFDKEYTATNIFDIQDEISRSVLKELQLSILTQEADTTISLPTENLEAYNYFLKATQLEISRRPKDLLEAMENYSKAIELDPKFAQAYARKAVIYNMTEQYGNLSHEDNLKGMRDNVQKAFVFNAQEPYAFYALGILEHHEGNGKEAYEAMKKAIELNPNFADAHLALSVYIGHGHDNDNEDDPVNEELSKEHLMKAFGLEPKSPTIKVSLAYDYADNNNYDRAFELIDEVIESNPDFTNSYYSKSILYSHDLGKIDEAFISVHKALIQEPNNLRLLVGIKRHATDLGMIDYAEEVLKVMKQYYPDNERMDFEEMEIEMMKGNYERGLEVRIKSYESFIDDVEEEDLLGYQRSLFADIMDNALLTGNFDYALKFGEEILPDLASDSVVLNNTTQLWAIEMHTLYEKTGNKRQANRILKALQNYDGVPRDTIGWSIRTGREKHQYYQLKIMERDFSAATDYLRQEYFSENSRAHSLGKRISMHEILMKDDPDYKSYIKEVDEDILRMRRNVEAYLKENQDWKSELDIRID